MRSSGTGQRKGKERRESRLGEHIPDELVRHILLGAKVALRRGIQGEVGVNITTDASAIVVDTADVPEGPTGGRRRSRNVTGVGLEEVHFIQGRTITHTTQESEEDEHDRAGREEQAEEAQGCSYKLSW